MVSLNWKSFKEPYHSGEPGQTMSCIIILDTTLRDGTQAEGISFSLEDKLAIAQRLDEVGIHYIEGGYPLSNPKDVAFFQEMKSVSFKQAKLAAFGNTRRRSLSVEEDPGIRALLDCPTETISLVAKCWPLHVAQVLRASNQENLAMIRESVSFLKGEGKTVLFDAEHFFDGFKEDPDYALRTVQVAAEAGADVVVLCDTNGGRLPGEVARAVRTVRQALEVPLGIHAHNDSGLAVANSLAAVEEGATHVQGTINGFGERCGNADLCIVIPDLAYKMGLEVLSEVGLRRLTELSRYVYELANVVPQANQPFVGMSAFAHKGGLHIDAIRKDVRTYEHLSPELVGNERRLLISELSGAATILAKTDKFKLESDKALTRKILQQVQDLENEGYQFEAAEASFELLVKKAMGQHRRFFDLAGFHVSVRKDEQGRSVAEATVKVVNPEGEIEHTAGEGDGPVNALDAALRKALEQFYPNIKEMVLVDYKVRVVNPKAATAAKVRVIIQSRDHEDIWSTIGVSENILEASYQALVDSIEYKLLKDEERACHG